MKTIALRCACGTVQGALRHDRPGDVARLVCRCESCRRWAQSTSSAAAIVDAAGGVELMQVAPSAVVWTAGAGKLEFQRLTTKGPYRWRARCCGSAMASNAPSPAFAHLTLPLSVPDVPAADWDAVFGAPWARVFVKEATAPVAGAPTSGFALWAAARWALARFLSRLISHRLHGRHKPHPMFVGETTTPIGEAAI